MAAGGADKAARYLIAGGALVPRAGAAPHVFTMMTAMILPSVCTFAFSDQLVEDCSRARLTAIRVGSRMSWARKACTGAALRGGFSALLAYGAGLGALLLVGGEEVSGFPGLLASVVLLALQQALLSVVASAAALRLGESRGVRRGPERALFDSVRPRGLSRQVAGRARAARAFGSGGARVARRLGILARQVHRLFAAAALGCLWARIQGSFLKGASVGGVLCRTSSRSKTQQRSLRTARCSTASRLSFRVAVSAALWESTGLEKPCSFEPSQDLSTSVPDRSASLGAASARTATSRLI